MPRIDSSVVTLISLTVAVIALLLGPGLGIRVFRWVRDKFRARSVRKAAILDYLRSACVFMEGLPLFFSQTWNWGPSVPNYAAGGSFPNQSTALAPEMGSVTAAVGDALDFYVMHSQQQGRPYPSEQETLSRFSEIHQRFWRALEESVKQEWPLRRRGILHKMRALKIPNSERDRIVALGTARRAGSIEPGS